MVTTNVTIADIARKAGVSPSTVSRVLSGTTHVSELKREAVLAAVARFLDTSDRTTFAFYAVTLVPFLALAVTFCLGLIIGSSAASPTRHTVGAVVGGAIVLAVLAIAWYFYPLHVDELIPRDEWQERIWFDSWI